MFLINWYLISVLVIKNNFLRNHHEELRRSKHFHQVPYYGQVCNENAELIVRNDHLHVLRSGNSERSARLEHLVCHLDNNFLLLLQSSRLVQKFIIITCLLYRILNVSQSCCVQNIKLGCLFIIKSGQ